MKFKTVIVPKNQPLIQKRLCVKGVVFLICDLVEINEQYWWETKTLCGYKGCYSYERTKLWAAHHAREHNCSILYRSDFRLIEDIARFDTNTSHRWSSHLLKLYFPFYRWDLK